MELEHQKIWRHTLLKIAHRGNLNGKTKHENQLWYLKEAIANGYDVEADLWLVGEDRLWLGHDGPTYFLNNREFESIMEHAWFHCKNLEVLDYLLNNYPNAKFFWHQNDNYALTSNRVIWAYPGMPVNKNTIVVDFNNPPNLELDCYGVCADYIFVDK